MIVDRRYGWGEAEVAWAIAVWAENLFSACRLSQTLSEREPIDAKMGVSKNGWEQVG
ncbi:MAG TPA: hypothetical protein IGS53_16470 [Leptolyngbyaceae cyanobacterium M33_DOE_097]|nr:hypothetical protein [Leptolyngbyaceae cyanobacterium M33_DOE_097]